MDLILTFITAFFLVTLPTVFIHEKMQKKPKIQNNVYEFMQDTTDFTSFRVC